MHGSKLAYKVDPFKFLTIKFGKFDYQYTLKRGLLPATDRLPHILATLTVFYNINLKFRITHKNLIKKRKCYFQELYLDVLNSNLILFVISVFDSNITENIRFISISF